MPEKAPSISIITATYNAAEHLPGLIESVRQQTDKDFEWIVIDGGSQDGTVDIIKSACDVITDYISERDHGIYDALNKGIKRCKTDYYLVLGADDRLEPDAVKIYKTHTQKYDNPDIIVAYVKTDNNTVVKPRKWLSFLYGPWCLFTSHSVGTLVRRSLHEEYGFYSYAYPIGADAEFLGKVMSRNKYVTMPVIAGTYNTKGASSKNKIKFFIDQFLIKKSIFPNFKPFYFMMLLLRLIKYYKVI